MTPSTSTDRDASTAGPTDASGGGDTELQADGSPPDDASTLADGSPQADAAVDAPADVTTDAGPADGSSVSCSGATPSLAHDVVPILVSHCSGEQCHGGTALGAFGGASGAYGMLVNKAPTRDLCNPGAVLVFPGDLGKSYLMNKLTGLGMCPGTERMPRGPTPLPASDIQTIADWICSGAPND